MENTKFEHLMEFVGQSIYNNFDINYEEVQQDTNILLDCMRTGYVLVEWPESQDYMEEEWFEEEAILALGSEDKTGSSAYFIPIKRVI